MTSPPPPATHSPSPALRHDGGNGLLSAPVVPQQQQQQQQQGSRLIVTNIVLTNFKSYAGVRELGPFHKNFTAIVGPNGSGKSNLIDALLFTFGKRAKKLRLKRVSELIHKSDDYPDFQEAKVEVHFCSIENGTTVTGDEDAYVEIPGSRFTLTRVAHKNDTSHYVLNGKRATLEEVETFMMAKGIDLNNNRFLILQGEVEAISMMPPKGANKNEEGLLEFLEDLIGTSAYVEEIETRQKAVEELSEARNAKLTSVKVAEKEKESITEPRNEALRFKELETARLRKTVKLNAIKMRKISNELESLRARRTAAAETYDSKSGETLKLRQEAQTLEASHEAERAAHAALVHSLEEAKKEFSAYERRAVQDSTKVKQLREKLAKCEEAARVAKQKLTGERERREAAAGEELPRRKKEVESATGALEKAETELSARLASTRGECEALRAEIESRRTALAPLATATRDCEGEVAIAETELEMITRASTTARKQLQETQKALKELKASGEKNPLKAAELKASVAEWTRRREEETEALKSLEAKERATGEELATLRARLEAHRAALARSSGSGPLAALTQAARRGGELEGCTLLGRLGDLGTVEEKYDVAVTTAAGGALDSLVCETTEGAERCVAHLRAKGLGVATFIILERLTYLQANAGTPSTNAAGATIPRLFDLVTPAQPKLAVAFYFALRETLVAESLNQAVEVAYGTAATGNNPGTTKAKHRVVTLKGELIDMSGTMSGGGKTARRGGMRLAGGGATNNNDNNQAKEEGDEEDAKSMTAQEASAAEKRVTVLEKELAKLREERMRRAEQLKGLEDSLAKAGPELAKLELDIEAFAERTRLLTRKAAELAPQCEMSPEEEAKADEVRRRLDERVGARNTARAKSSAVEAEIAALEARLENAGGESVKSAKTAVERAREALDRARTELTKAEVSLESHGAAVEKAAGQAERAGGELEKASAALEAAEASAKETESKAARVAEVYEKARESEETKRTALDRLKKEYAALKESLNKSDAGLVEMKIALEALDDEIAKHTKLHEKWAADLKAAEKSMQSWSTAAAAAAEKEKVAEAEEEEEEGEGEEEAKKKTEEEEDHEEVDEAALETELRRIESEAAVLRGNVNMGAIAEYAQREREYLKCVGELDEATAARDAARAACDELRKRRLVEFMAGFSVISLKLKEIYQLITLGGDAELELVDALDPFSEGVVFSVRPPKKSWKNIANLSGGEKTLSSLSLVFALHHYKPAPLYVMDEIDAALDFKNVSIVGNYIKERTRDSQFLIISLRNNMFELAERLVGIYKTHNATKSVTINPARVAEKSEQLVKMRAASRREMKEDSESADREADVPEMIDEENVMVSRRNAKGKGGGRAVLAPPLPDAESAPAIMS